MKYTEIGRSGIKIPSIIFGTSALGNLYRALDSETKLAIVKECLLSLDGQVAFDSAGKYGAGLALEELGKKLADLEADPGRIIISNKLGWFRTELREKEPSFEQGIWINISHDAVQKISYDGILSCRDQGNRLLGGRYLPRLLSVHDPDEYLSAAGDDEELKEKHYRNILEAYEALGTLKNSGEQIAIGVGAKEWKVIRKISEDVDLDWVMFANSLTLYTHPPDLVSFISELAKRKVTVINSAVFNAGFLTGGNYFNYRFIDQNDPVNRNLFEWREQFLGLCKDFSVNPSHACIKFGMSHPSVSSLALNTSDPSHVSRNVEAIGREIPGGLFDAMKDKGLIDRNYPYV
jgi:D-threo-aldose 1-dehydrogenase